MEEFLSENDYNKTILGYRVGNTFIDVKYEDCIKRYEYSLRLEKLILSQMEKQIEQKFEEEYDDKKVAYIGISTPDTYYYGVCMYSWVWCSMHYIK